MMTHKTTEGMYGEVHYWISGKNNKETLLFIHGALMDHNLFSEQISYFSTNYNIITIDVPWHGLSTPYEPFSLKSAADDVVKILHEENIKEVHLVGQSMGGLIAQIIALHYPGKAASLAVIGSAPMQPKYYTNLNTLRFERFIISLLPYKFLVKKMASKVCSSTQGQSYVFEMMKQHSKSKLLEIMIKIPADALKYVEDKKLDIPVLITYGDMDKSMNIQEYCNRWAELEKRELKVIENASHNANLDNPGMFNKILNDFLLKNK